MADALIDFLRARLDEDIEAVRHAYPYPWRRDGINTVEDFGGGVVVHGDGGPPSTGQADFIARFNPGRVMDDIRADQELIDFCEDDPLCHDGGWAYIDRVLRILAASYVDHPDFRPEWSLASSQPPSFLPELGH